MRLNSSRRTLRGLLTYKTNMTERSQIKKLSDMTLEILDDEMRVCHKLRISGQYVRGKTVWISTHLAVVYVELREEVVRLQMCNQNLVNAVKNQAEVIAPKWTTKPFDFKDTRKRHILLWVSYLGWSFNGFMAQQNTNNTVEDIVKESLRKVNLCEDLTNYSRCGRTDKGVSAFSQVLSLDIRSIQPYDHSPLTTPELPYCAMLNRVLPPDLRAIAWRPAKEGYNARFECTKRAYKYFFPKGNLNIEAMQKACTLLEGTHDFRNLCKMDVGNGVTNFIRNLESAKIEQLKFQQDMQNSEFNMFCLTIQSSGFLYHQIRCIMHILILVGEENESPEVLNELMDVEKNPRKPQYSPVHELPLNLFSVEYPADGFDWIFAEDNMQRLEKHYLDEWTLHACKTAMLRSIVGEVSRLNPVKSLGWHSSVLKAGSKGKHHPLMSRQKGESLEDRINHFVKKRKIMVVEDDEETRVVKVPKTRIDLEGQGEIREAAIIQLSNTLEKVKEKLEFESSQCNRPEDEVPGAQQTPS